MRTGSARSALIRSSASEIVACRPDAEPFGPPVEVTDARTIEDAAWSWSPSAWHRRWASVSVAFAVGEAAVAVGVGVGTAAFEPVHPARRATAMYAATAHGRPIGRGEA